MAREALSVEQVATSGLAATYTTIGVDGVSFPNANDVFIHVKATTAANITIATPFTLDEGLTVEDRVVSVSGGGEQFIGPFSDKIYEQADGSIYVDSDQTDTDIAILKV